MESLYRQTPSPLSEAERRAQRAIEAGERMINPTQRNEAMSAEHELREYMQELGLRQATKTVL